MGRNKDQFLNKTGGIRIGESDKEFQMRVSEIEMLERKFVSDKLSIAEREKVQRRICQLKGIDFDSDD